LSGQPTAILLVQELKNEPLLGAVVVVELAQRNPGLISHLSCRQAAIAVDQ
jgi:hypothetical protein